MAQKTINGIQFNNIKTAGIELGQWPVILAGQSGPDEDGGAINAVDIDWNGAIIDSNTTINTTGELFSLIKNLKNSQGNANISLSQSGNSLKANDVVVYTPSIPSKTSELLNDSGFITTSDIPEGSAASTTLPKEDGEASHGEEMAFARGDHRHPHDTSKQDVISASNKVNADFISDTNSTNKFVTAQDKSNWNNKQDAIADLTTIRNQAAAGATAIQPGQLAAVATTGNYSDLSGKPTIPAAQIQADWNQTDSSKLDFIKNKPTISGSSNLTLSYDSTTGKIQLKSDGNVISEFSTNSLIEDVVEVVNSGVSVDDDTVDLGLPSGIKWAKGNIVKDSQGNYSVGEETDFGCYFTWGNIDGHNDDETQPFGSNYNLESNYNNTTGRKLYNDDIPSENQVHNAPYALLGKSWDMPKYEDFEELVQNTSYKLDTIDGIKGVKFCKIVNGVADNNTYIFLPFSGVFGETLEEQNGAYTSEAVCYMKYPSSTIYKDSYDYRTGKAPLGFVGKIFENDNSVPQQVYITEDIDGTPIENTTVDRFRGLPIRAIKYPHSDITITLVDENEAPIGNIKVKLVDKNNIIHTGTTDTYGSVYFDFVRNGVCSVNEINSAYSKSTDKPYSNIIVTKGKDSFDINPVHIENGVYAYDETRGLLSYENADSNAIGVAVITDDCSFIIGKEDLGRFVFGAYGRVLYAKTYSYQALANNDFDGVSNTENIYNSYRYGNWTTDSDDVQGLPAIEACISAFDGTGYMGSAGEWQKVKTYETEINSMMTKIGGTALNSSYNYWTSTLQDSTQNGWIIATSYGQTQNKYRKNTNNVRAFKAF